jgi:hypothetical protein
VVVQLLLVGLYLSSVAVRTLWRGRDVIPFEVVQTVAALAVGLGGAVAVTRASGMGAQGLGWAAIVMGAAAYAVAFAYVGRRTKTLKNFAFYASLALVLVMVGTGVLLPDAWLILTWVTLGTAAAVLARRFDRASLIAHAATYLTASAGGSGLLTYAGYVLIGTPAGPLGWMTPLGMLVCLGAGLSSLMIVTERPGLEGRLTVVPRLVLIVVFALGLASTLVVLLWIATGNGPAAPRMGHLATMRTSVLALLALGTAWCGGRVAALGPCGLLVYPVLALTGFKLLVEDLPSSSPSTLFIAFAVYGAALIVAPRLRRRRGE